MSNELKNNNFKSHKDLDMRINAVEFAEKTYFSEVKQIPDFAHCSLLIANAHHGFSHAC